MKPRQARRSQRVRILGRLHRKQPELFGALIVGDSLVALLKTQGAPGHHVALIALLCVEVPVVLLTALAPFTPAPHGVGDDPSRT